MAKAKAAEAKQLKVTLNSTAIQPDNACTRGKIFKVKHLITVEEV